MTHSTHHHPTMTCTTQRSCHNSCHAVIVVVVVEVRGQSFYMVTIARFLNIYTIFLGGKAMY